MNWLYLIVAVTGGVIVWPIMRWVLDRDGKVEVLGFWVSLTISIICMAVVILRKQNFLVMEVWISGVVLALTYSIGFCKLIMYCLKIGPVGPTVTVNNMGLVFGVLYSLLWLAPHMPDWEILIGVLGICLALIFLGLSKRDETAGVKKISRKWLKLVFAGCAFNGLSFMAQTYVGVRYPNYVFLFLGAGCLIAALILLRSMFLIPDGFFRRRELIGGMLVGISNAIAMSSAIAAIRYFGAEVVLPVTVVIPIVIMLLIGQFIYREHLDCWGWAGCVMGFVSVGLLACTRQGGN